jgi:indole-3-glycerol phosphate synthase
MKSGISQTLHKILLDTREEIACDKSRQSLKRLKHMKGDAPPILSFSKALASGRGLIAEIKERSPSQGKMRSQNFLGAPAAYKSSRLVKAVSVLTNRTHFGENMKLEFLKTIKERVSKPVLRKDFIIDEYQVYQARAYGADAILLMANILDSNEMKKLSHLAFELGMEVLFETHRVSELEEIPEGAKIIGINCRNFDVKIEKFFRQWLGAQRDTSVNIKRFGYVEKIPDHFIKVAESGVTAENCEEVFSLGFDSVLVGTSLLMDTRGIKAALSDFESAITGSRKTSRSIEPSLEPSLS